MKRVLVETVLMFRMRYVVTLNDSDPNEYALDTVTMQEAEEFSQKYLDETIISHREISEEEVLALCDIDNDYAAEWPKEKKLEVFVTKAPH